MKGIQRGAGMSTSALLQHQTQAHNERSAPSAKNWCRWESRSCSNSVAKEQETRWFDSQLPLLTPQWLSAWAWFSPKHPAVTVTAVVFLWYGPQCAQWGVYCTCPREVCCGLLMGCSMSENAALITCLTYLSLGLKPVFTQHSSAHTHTVTVHLGFHTCLLGRDNTH